MTTEQIKAMQERIGVKADGFWGPISIGACKTHLRSLMPIPNPWPDSDQASLQKFYGSPGDEDNLTSLRLTVPVFYGGKLVSSIRCHHRVAASLGRIIEALHKLRPEILERYDGCYNNRPMRGGSLPSLHARGAAIDLDASANGNLVHWPAAATMPLEIMEVFAREGWLSAGAFWGRDAMHFQATR